MADTILEAPKVLQRVPNQKYLRKGGIYIWKALLQEPKWYCEHDRRPSRCTICGGSGIGKSESDAAAESEAMEDTEKSGKECTKCGEYQELEEFQTSRSKVEILNVCNHCRVKRSIYLANLKERNKRDAGKKVLSKDRKHGKFYWSISTGDYRKWDTESWTQNCFVCEHGRAKNGACCRDCGNQLRTIQSYTSKDKRKEIEEERRKKKLVTDNEKQQKREREATEYEEDQAKKRARIEEREQLVEQKRVENLEKQQEQNRAKIECHQMSLEDNLVESNHPLEVCVDQALADLQGNVSPQIVLEKLRATFYTNEGKLRIVKKTNGHSECT